MSQPHSGCGCSPVVCDPNNEPVASALNNFIVAFFGSLTKTCVNDQVVWTLPCDLESGVSGFPRLPNEGVACYLIRLYAFILTQIGGGSLLTTKGDLLSFSTSSGRFPVGTNGQYLISDPTQPFGLRWSTVAPGSNSYKTTNISAGGSFNWTAGVSENYQRLTGTLAAPCSFTLLAPVGIQNGEMFHVRVGSLTTTSVNKLTFNDALSNPIITLDDDITQTGNIEFIYDGSGWVLWSSYIH